MPLVDYSTYFILSKKLEITLLFDSLLPATLTERSDVNNLMKGFSSHFQKFQFMVTGHCVSGDETMQNITVKNLW